MEISGRNTEDKPTIGITIGDINGIGPEVIIKALSDSRILNYLTPVIYGSTKVLSFYRKAFKVNDFNYSQVKSQGSFSPKRINVVNCWDKMMNIEVGVETPEGGNSAFLALEKAVEDLQQGKIEAVVTAPINKNNIQSEDFQFPGHTEYFTQKFNGSDSLMMMVSDQLRVGVATAHVPLNQVSQTITKEALTSKLKIMLQSLKKDFGRQKPKLAVLGLNPHAGEEGLLGMEEKEVIIPVIEEFKNKGHLVFGPYPADGFFGLVQHIKFDGVMAMYHDQGLIPFKTIAFEKGVNFTAGLPIIRTSPDHGTAYNIAGKGQANESSMREAIYLALDIIKMRMEQKVENTST
ncbi:MAG: 4-hydroxythreonine-4-phosphate dehydrogenase PdxA [Candidatus Cyclobacteriaceae bacterium M3_2C_046]